MKLSESILRKIIREELEEAAVKILDAWDEGWNAYIDGQDETDNPYEGETMNNMGASDDYQEWKRGYRSAEIERAGKSDEIIGKPSGRPTRRRSHRR